MPRLNHVLAIDQGTTSSRAIVFKRDGAVLGAGQQEITQYFPQPGWVNHDATEIWQTTLHCIKQALGAARLDADDIAAIGIANQRETTIVWDRATGAPLAPAIVWQSRESARLVNDLEQRGQAAHYQPITGLVPDAYFSATKLALMLERDPELRRKSEAGEALFGTVDSWLVWNLTGGKDHLTDVTNASRTMLFDIHRLEWSQPLLDDLAIPPAMLPRVVWSSGVLGETEPALLGASLPIAGIAGDQQAALFGQTCFAPGQAKNTYGTGSFLLMQTGDTPSASRHRLLTTIAWQIGQAPRYALEGAVFVTGAAVQWLRDGLGIISTAAEIEALAGSEPDAGGVVFVPALSGLGAPYWDSRAGGMLIGLSRGTTRGHIARATLEAIVQQTADVLEAMVADSGIALEELRVDGGAARNDLLMQMQSDVLGVRVVRPRQIETTALGVAYLAGLATGVWQSTEEIAGQWQIDRVFEPAIGESARRASRDRWQEAVSRTRGWHEAG